ncbi:glycosyl hydrolases family 38 N-terminal domain-containing protein [Chytriomyces sp. MP71]|nr:glycosyl hydrolases family 38 N-terminal domain-containing protein [Chytriomyces sp. MP71]
MAPPTKNLNTLQKQPRHITIAKLDKFVERGHLYENLNLRPWLWRKRTEAGVSVSVYSVPDLKRIPFDEAIRGNYRPTRVGDTFGPSWSTHWFKIDIIMPAEVEGMPVSLYFNSECEGLIFSAKGVPLQGLTGGDSHPMRSFTDGGDWHVDFPLTTKSVTGSKLSYFIEIGCNGRGGVSNNPNLYFRLGDAELRVAHEVGQSLFNYFDMLCQIVKTTREEEQLNADALYTANEIVNNFRVGDEESVIKGLSIATRFFETKKGSENNNRHEIIAIGNCHLDTAWRWPFAETKRKVARSFSTQIGLMKRYPRYVFTASAAQHFEWVRDNYPSLFAEMQVYAKGGKFLPVGGTWVEMDTNMPSGEALVRQFLYGQRFFEKHFGERCRVFWLPDTFGYSSQLPQIAKSAGISYFMTTKLAWNSMNKFPHTTFNWKGLDGSTVLAHLPPNNNIMSQGTIKDVVDSAFNNRDNMYSRKSMVIYGNGDGGGGPLAHMLDKMKLIENLEGLPAKITYGGPNEFFESLSQTSKDIVEWKGELYFEAHRGTYTTAGFVKKNNRKCETLLKQVEYLHSLAILSKPNSRVAAKLNPSYYAGPYPKEELDRLWKLQLLCQFHDVLPGTSIGLVFGDAKRIYDDIQRSCEKLIKEALEALENGFVGVAEKKKRGSVFDLFGGKKEEAIISACVLNLTPWPVDSLIELSAVSVASLKHKHQLTKLGTALVYAGKIEGSSSCIRAISDIKSTVDDVKLRHDDKGYTLENQHFILQVDVHGRLTSLIHKASGRETIDSDQLGNVLKLFSDCPLQFDAWDVEPYQLEVGWDAGAPLGSISVEESGPLRVVLKVRHELTETSWLLQRIIVTAVDEWVDFDTFVEWNENRVMLRVEFPVAVNSDVATYETQYGVIQRPTHYNTSWDLARFEVCGHRFADVSEYGFGVALLNDSKYGYGIKGNVMRLSLLRAPKEPYDQIDMGQSSPRIYFLRMLTAKVIGSHSFKYALYPHKGSFDAGSVVQKGMQYNMPPIVHEMLVPWGHKLAMSTQNYFAVDALNLVLDTFKRVEDAVAGKLEFILRFYEAYGGRGVARFTSIFKIVKASFANIMEDDCNEVAVDEADGSLLIPYSPFKIVTLKLFFAHSASEASSQAGALKMI